jgi:hypothetical protein
VPGGHLLKGYAVSLRVRRRGMIMLGGFDYEDKKRTEYVPRLVCPSVPDHFRDLFPVADHIFFVLQLDRMEL